MFIGAGIGAWFIFGDPPRTVAGWGWPDDAAPWETVDAFYYPNHSDLSVHRFRGELNDVSACRASVAAEASSHGDPRLERSGYECGLGTPYDWNGFKVYRDTVS